MKLNHFPLSLGAALASLLGFLHPAVALGQQSDSTVSGLKKIPSWQAIPEPYEQVSFQWEGKERARLHFGQQLRRPFIYPIIGPLGAGLTRMGHPHDPVGHSHHNSFWVSHHDVNGVEFWADQGKNLGRIVTQRLEQLEDGEKESFSTLFNHWINPEGKVLLEERRRVTLKSLPNQETLILLDLRFEAPGESVSFGKTPFGLVATRVAKTMGVTDGGGMLRNSEGKVGEQGENGCFWKRARWCDYSGQAAPGVVEGLTLLDHPANPGFPAYFHVRADGWMGASLSFEAPVIVQPGTPLLLRYGLYVHRACDSLAPLQVQWEAFSQLTVPDLAPKKKP